MTVQELYNLAQRHGDPRKIELKLHPHDDEIAEVEFEEEDGEISAHLVLEGSIHL